MRLRRWLILGLLVVTAACVLQVPIVEPPTPPPSPLPEPPPAPTNIYPAAVVLPLDIPDDTSFCVDSIQWPRVCVSVGTVRLFVRESRLVSLTP